MKSNMQNRALVVKKSTKNATKNNFENSARQKVVLIGKRDLEKNSIISRTTKGGFKQAKKQQVQIFDPNAMVSKQNWKAPKKIELDEEEYFDTLEKIIQRDFFPNLYRETDGLGDTKSEFGEAYKKSQTKLNLNEFLRRYSSEDNIAFEDLQEKDRQKFIKRISWMYDESAKFNKINKLALEYGHKNQV